jgi:SAM-dependent methyltransferase
MAEDITQLPLHSALYFGDTRDHWWNDDFLALMARRWQLDSARRVLDVGSGVGHWARIIGRFLPADAHVTGVEREPEWVRIAAERSDARRFTFQVGTAEALPFADDSFDLATCQTVLMHLPDPVAALREMVRVVRPGGLVAVAEPNVLAESLVPDSTLSSFTQAEVLLLVELQMTCLRGRQALGEGDHTVGSRLPAVFQDLGLHDIRAFLNDKALAILPPYRTPEMAALVREAEKFTEEEIWWWKRSETLRLFVAGGGAEGDFDVRWQLAMRCRRQMAEDIRAGTYSAGGGGLHYCVSGRKADRLSQ